MRIDLYQIETVRIATEQTALLDEAQQIIMSGNKLSRLEQSGVLHAWQVLVENAIGKSKQLLKAAKEPVPISAYDSFDSLVRCGKVSQTDLEHWNSVIGLRNRIVHDYMNIDMKLVIQLIRDKQYLFISDFLCQPIPDLDLDR